MHGFGYHCSCRIESSTDLIEATGEKVAIRKNHVDFIGSIGDALGDECGDLYLIIVASGKIDHSRNCNSFPFEIPRCTSDETRPHAHCSNFSVLSDCALAELVDIFLCTCSVEIGQIDETEDSPCRSRSLGHETKPARFSGPNEVGRRLSIVNAARTPSGPHA